MTLNEKINEAQERRAQNSEQVAQSNSLDLYTNLDDFLTIKQVCALCKVSSTYLLKLRLDGYNKDKDGNLRADFIPFVKLGKNVLYKKADILEWIERNTKRG